MSLRVIISQSANEQRASADTLNHCVAVKQIMNWQAVRYRAAVADNRWFMSQRQSRYVGWHEAELDFCQHNTYGCAKKWRLEYCGEQCTQRTRCRLATLFIDRDRPVAA